LLAACLSLAGVGRGSPGPSSSARPVAVFGVDAADWRAIDERIASGGLPAFARLRRSSVLGVLRADPPLLSPIIWTTIATGRDPEDHGVLDFMVDVPGGPQVPVHGGVRRTKAAWEIWSDAGRRVLVAGWWATWPADRVRGVVVSDRLTTRHLRGQVLPDRGLVYPPEAGPSIARAVVAPSSISFEALSGLIPVTRAEFDRALEEERSSASGVYRDPIAHLRAALAASRTWRAVVAAQLAQGSPDLVMVCHDLVDTVSHLFVRDRVRGERAIAAAYAEVDAALADMAAKLDPATMVVVVSDHGFHAPDAGIREDPADLTAGASAWHRPYGIFAAAPAGVIAGTVAGRPASNAGTLSPLDVLPTLLAYAGLPLAADMPGRIVPGVGQTEGLARVPSYGAHVLPEPPPTLGASARAAELERLRALGYVSGSGATSLWRTNLGEILYRKGDYRGAVRELEAVVRADALNQRAQLWLARSHAASGRPDEALQVYDRMIRAAAAGGDAVDPIVFLAANDIDLDGGRPAAARSRLGRVPAALAKSPEVLIARGRLAEVEGRPTEAEREYRAALAVAPSDPDALQRLVDLLIREGKADLARTLAARTAQAFPSSAAHLSLAGEAALALKKYAEAVRWFETALELAPDADSVRTELSRARLLNGDPSAALEALEGTRSSRETESLRGAALAGREDWPGAIAAYDRAMSFGPPTTELLNALGHALLRGGRSADARKTLERSLAMVPEQPAIRALLETVPKR
jgi:tetratricopeptide (TPR) repeat protein